MPPTLVTCQAGKKRRSVTNALGHLTDVWEITARDAATQAVSFPGYAGLHGYKTSYHYDTLNNLTTVNQGLQTRSFTYSSLSRLLLATNPESGTISYQYDPNGNLTSKTDARGVVTSYVYDALNRVTQRSYSTPNGTPGVGVLANYQATPNVSYFYDDVNVPFSKGRLTKVTSSISETRYNAFDNLGRVLSSSQVTDGQTYNFTYTYNLSGALIEQTYPSGRVVKNVLESDGDLSMVQSKKTANSGFFNYAKHFTYAASGAVISMRLGNGLWESTQFNSRLQPVQIGLGTSVASQNLLKLNYDYGTDDNNGNVLSQTITVPAVGQIPGFTAVQNYSYDSLNRLKSAVENVTPHGGRAVQSWKQTYSFDRYGNRRFDEPNTTTLPKNCGTPPNQIVCPADVPIVNPTISTANNRLSSTGWQYDAAGNTTADPQGRTFIYDAENKQTEVRDQYNTVIGQYFFDGDGKRVKKIVPGTGEVTIFVYDAGAKLIAEYSTVVAPVENAKVAYLTADHLGSPRINTDATGNVIARHDYMPFGEEIYTAQRTPSLGYTADTVRKQFTGYERDIESELDFAQARYYNPQHGRFTGVDPILSSATIYDPQTWNRYSYALNTPLKYTDPLGMYICDGDKKQCQNIENGLKKGQEALKKLDPKSEQYKLLDRALKTYGAAGVDNGLTIKFGATKTGAPAETSGIIRDRDQDGKKDITADNPTGRDITITFDPDKNKGEDYAYNLAHEGSHAADRTDFIAAVPLDLASDAATAMFENSPLNLTKYETETTAYRVSAAVAQGLGKDSLMIGISKIEIWNSGWKQADLAAGKSKQGTQIDKVLAEPKSKGGLYEVTKDKPGPKFF